MIEIDGEFLQETIKSLGLKNGNRAIAIENSKNIVNKIIASYNAGIGKGHVGSSGTGVPSTFSSSKPGPIGLIYGRIQSGKTRAMIVSTAMAFDNKFRIAVVMTSNINDLVSQTHADFTKDLNGVRAFTKDDELDNEVEDAKLDLECTKGCILVIASKGAKSLKNITEFLKKVDAEKYPMVIFDDEGDQASLDTNTYKRSSTGDLTLQPSPINKLIKKLRGDFPASVYISVTGTPQAVLLQSALSDHKPSFIVMLPPGEGYIGGDHFFKTELPEKNPNNFITLVPDADKTELLDKRRPIPIGLKSSILFFLLSASAAVRKIGYPTDGREKDKGYQFLCHPSLKNSEQAQARDRIGLFLTNVKKVLLGLTDSWGINEELNKQYNELKKQIGERAIPSLDDLKITLLQELIKRKILVINASNTKRKGIEYGAGFNFLIGGNTLGRGIAIPNLLVTYYVRSARTSQIDTMHQHARMFGYRTKTIKYTRLFITKNLYDRFRNIHISDTGLRNFLMKHLDAQTFPVEFAQGLRPTRKSVLDVNSTEIVYEGMQIYPNYLKLPQSKTVYNSVMHHIKGLLGTTNEEELQKKGKSGVIIPIEKAIEIVSHIRTKSQNVWHDKTIVDVLKKLDDKLDNGSGILLKFRRAKRTIEAGGLLSQGTISGKEQNDGRLNIRPTLWIMDVIGNADSATGSNEKFVYPTVIVPNSLPQVFVFSKK